MCRIAVAPVDSCRTPFGMASARINGTAVITSTAATHMLDPNPQSPESKRFKIDKSGDSKRSRATSCERCKRRKQKCDHRLPICTNCLKAGEKCIQPEKYALHVPTKDEYTLLLEARIQKLEKEKIELVKLYSNGNLNGSSNTSNTTTTTTTMTNNSGSNSNNFNNNSSTGISGSNSNFVVGTARPSQHNSPLNVNTTTTATSAIHSPTSSVGSFTHTQSFSQPPSSQSHSLSYSQTQPSSISTPGTVNILNADPVTGASAPRSFSVVSSLLQETFWGRNKDFDFTHNNVSPGAGLLPDYNFDEYLKYKPIKPPDDFVGSILLDFLKERFSFLDRGLIFKLYEERHTKPAVMDDQYRYHSFLLYAVLAIVCLTRGRQRGEYQEQMDPFRYYSTALCHAKLCQHPRVEWKITALQICSMVQMRTELDGGQHFEMVSRSMKLCVEIGLHKGEGLDELNHYEREMRKRLFWNVYGFERLLTVSTGRPFFVPEEEVTVALPLDIEEQDLRDDAKVNMVINTPENQLPATSLTFTLSLYKLRRLESQMVMDIYRSEQTLATRLKRVNQYLEMLETWRDHRHHLLTPKEKVFAGLAYSKSVRLLLQPFLGGMTSDNPLFIKCVEETGRIASVMRDFYRNGDTGFTTIAMHTNFVAGLTLIYCLCLAKGNLVLEILEHLRCCTSTLYILTEKSRLCANYRDTLDTLTAATVRHIKQHKIIEDIPPTSAVTSASTEQPISSSPFVPSSNMAPMVSGPVNVNTPSQTPTSDFDPVKTETGDVVNSLLRTSGTGPGMNAASVPQSQQVSLPTATATTVATPVVATAASTLSQPPSNHQQQSVPNRAWVDSYGYDDTMYNMIQDISSITQNNKDSFVTSPQESDFIWFDMAEFGYS